GAVLAVPAGDLRRAVVPGVQRHPADAGPDPARAPATVGLAALVAARGLADARRLPQPGPGHRRLRVDASGPTAPLVACAIRRGRHRAARAQPSHARQRGLCGGGIVGAGRRVRATVRARTCRGGYLGVGRDPDRRGAGRPDGHAQAPPSRRLGARASNTRTGQALTPDDTTHAPRRTWFTRSDVERGRLGLT